MRLPFKRYRGNPIITAQDIPYPCNTVFNAGACRFGDQYVLLLRVEDLRGISHFTLAWSKDGYHFQVEGQPWITRAQEEPFAEYERFGIEDPRITPLDGAYYVAYTGFGPAGPRVVIGATEDFRTFRRISLATEVDNKDAALFPEKINGLYCMLDRPGGMGGKLGSIWITFSPDLIYWGRAQVVLTPEAGWGRAKLGTSTPPLKTPHGWLVLYHGVRHTPGGRLYRVGAMLLDLEQPQRVLAYTPHFVFGPEELYERTGDVPNVVFPCGWVLEDDGETIKMYYGAADTCIGLAETTLKELLQLCIEPPHSDWEPQGF